MWKSTRVMYPNNNLKLVSDLKVPLKLLKSSWLHDSTHTPQNHQDQDSLLREFFFVTVASGVLIRINIIIIIINYYN